MSNKFRAMFVKTELDGVVINISEVDGQEILIRQVAVIPETAVPQFLDDVQKIADEWQWQVHTGDGAKPVGCD